jgi:pyruvate/2-oxoglutarate dehydrogenase complex dihydrolipoamide acyltransferase (E2) component
LTRLTAHIDEVAAAVRIGPAPPETFRGGTFTIGNDGSNGTWMGTRRSLEDRPPARRGS